MQKEIDTVEVSDNIFDYICNITQATRDSNKYPQILYGASPRA